MANIKFSQFSESTDVANVDFVVGYDGATNVRISPTNFINTAGGPFLPLAGGTMTGGLRLNDDVQLLIGSSLDLLLVHNGTNSYMSNYTGDLYIENAYDNGQIIFKTDNGTGGTATYLALDGNTTHAYFTNPGNVGIGTSSPNQLLELKKTSGTVTARLHADHESSPATGIEFMRGLSDTWGGDAYTDWKIGSGSSSEADFAITSKDTTSGENERFSIEYNTGNVGIGTNSPTEKLHVKTASNTTVLIEGNQSTRFATLQLKNAAQSWMARCEGTSEDFTIRDDTGASEPFRINPATSTGSNDLAITINGGGNVGIGTASPEVKLTIKSDAVTTSQPVRITNTVTDTHTGLFLNNTGNAIGEKYGMQFGGYNQYSIGGIFGVLDSVSGSTSGDITFDMGNGTASGALVERMRITHEGDVGIGTTTPGYKLEVDGTARITSALTFGGNVNNIITGTGSSLDFKSNGDYFFRKGANTNLTILADGNVGVGTTSPSSFNSRGRNLVVNSDGDTGITISANATSSSTLLFADAFAGTGGTATYRGAIEYDHADDSMAFSTSAAEKMRIDTAGNVGIGTTTPTTKFQVAGNSTYISVINTSNNKAIELGADSSGDGQIIMRDGSNNNKLLFYAEANANNYINNGGNFGIGTASPTAKLQVVGLAEHADNAAAITAGLTTGAFYRTGDLLKVVH